MDLVLVDDSSQDKPSREGMGPLVSAGGLHVPGESVGRGTFFRSNVTGKRREAFFRSCLLAAHEHRARAFVVVADTRFKTPLGVLEDPEFEVVRLFLDRVKRHTASLRVDAMLLADRPPGGPASESKFVSKCLQAIHAETALGRNRIALVCTGDSETTRLLQLADLIVGCTLAFVGGERNYAPPLFEGFVKPVLRSSVGRIGGIGLTIHPDHRYANLYHWLLGDARFSKHGRGHDLPLEERPYFESADAFPASIPRKCSRLTRQSSRP